MHLASQGSSAYKLMPARKPQIEKMPQKDRQAAKNKKLARRRLVLIVICAFFVQLFLCYRWVALYGLHSEVERQSLVLADLQRENEQKSVAIDRITDLSRVEEYAVKELGMQKAEPNQIVYIKPEHGDSMQKVVKNSTPYFKRGFFGALSSSFVGLLEYLK